MWRALWQHGQPDLISVLRVGGQAPPGTVLPAGMRVPLLMC